MSEHAAHRLEIGSDAIYIERHTGTIALGWVFNNTGKAIVVHSHLENTGGNGYTSERHHPSEIFSLVEAAAIAEELLAPPEDGHERLLRVALTEVATDPVTSAELRIRLESEALYKRLNTPRTDEELGAVSKDKLVGSPKQYGSNSWRLNEMIEGIQSGNYSTGASNELVLASVDKKDIDLLPTAEASRIRNLIDEVNRDALNQLYDDYYVDFSKARVWEKTHGEYYKRLSIYPSVSGLYSFVETHIHRSDEIPLSNSPIEVSILVGSPTDPAKQGFSPAI